MLQKSESKQIWRLKYLLILPLIMGMLVYTAAEGQVPDQDPSIGVPFSVVEEVPIFPGCEGATDRRACFNEKLNDHIADNFRYPEEAQKRNIQGRVTIMFVIQRDGSIGNVRMRGPDELLEDEAARIISLLPKMAPGKQRGQTVGVPYSIPITFKLGSSPNDDTDMEKNALSSMKLANALIFIDGKESSQEKMDKLNPDSIKSVNIIKDKEQLEKYGAKGENGVIFIITKK